MYKVTNIEEVMAANSAAGFHFFDSGTMLFFASRIHGDLLPGKRFITSEKRCWDDDTRRYTVRKFDVYTGHIETVGEFNQYETFEEALEAAKKL